MHSLKDGKLVFKTNYHLMQVKSILLTFIKLLFVIKIFVWSIFEWPFYTGLTVLVIQFVPVTLSEGVNDWQQYDKCSKILNASCLPKNLDKQHWPRSECSWRSSLIRVFPVCYSDKHFCEFQPWKPTLLCLFDLLLYVPSTIYQLNRDGSSWVEPVLNQDKCVLLKDHNAVTPVRLEPAASRSRVKCSTTEPLCSQNQHCILEPSWGKSVLKFGTFTVIVQLS